MKIFIYIIFFFCITLFADITEYKITSADNNQYMYIKILDTKLLRFSGVSELSGLSYRDKKLYALSDKGILYQFLLDIKHDKIQTLQLQHEYKLRNTKLQRFKRKKRDSEGLASYRSGFLISFERQERVLYCSRKGIKIRKMKLNPLLENRKNYQSANKGLESVTYSPKYGLITAPELPLKNQDSKYHTLYAKNRVWRFQAEGAVTDITFLDKDSVIVLLREYSYLTQHRVTSLVEVNLQKCNKQDICKERVLAKLDSADGWHIDNFEGLTKVGKNRFLMVSDDNDSIFQKTLLVLFEIMN